MTPEEAIRLICFHSSSEDGTVYDVRHRHDLLRPWPLVPERREGPVADILRPVRWNHVLAPYVPAGVLATALLTHQIGAWGDDPTGTVIILGALSTLLLVLARQLAIIAEQRRKIQLEQRGVIATISHELRTPLTAVVGFLDLLEDWELFNDDEKQEMVALMRDQSHVLARRGRGLGRRCPAADRCSFFFVTRSANRESPRPMARRGSRSQAATATRPPSDSGRTGSTSSARRRGSRSASTSAG